MTSKRKPDYNLVIQGELGYHTIGHAWKWPDGSINIFLNPYVAIPTGEQIKAVLYPKDYVPRTERESKS